jgi:RNA polymerase sigma factor (TIGR02999 family)
MTHAVHPIFARSPRRWKVAYAACRRMLRTTTPGRERHMEPENGEVTKLLDRWRQGDPEVLESLAPLVYQQLHAIARGYMRRERDDHTLQPTALVSEVFLRLLNQHKVTWYDRAHFFTFAARMMRNILKDYARAHLADRRGGVGVIKLPLSEDVEWIGSSPEEMLDLNWALDRLEELDPRKAQAIELRFFLALSMEETADVMAISLATAERDLKFARSWLYQELRAKKEDGRVDG